MKYFTQLLILTIFIVINLVDSQTELGPCICDLSPSRCDVNCCCDTLCTTEDIQTFSFCLYNEVVPDSEKCIPSVILFLNNTDYQVKTVGSNLCYYNDSYALRNYYNAPILMAESDSSSVTSFLKQKFPPPVTTISFSSKLESTRYSVNSDILTYYNSPQGSYPGELGLPKPKSSGECDDSNAAKFYVAESYSCKRTATIDATTCATLNILQPGVFYGSDNLYVFDVPSTLSLTSNGTLDLDNTTLVKVTQGSCQDSLGAVCFWSNYTGPTSAGASCNNVVTEVEYVIGFVTSTMSITSVSVNFVLGNITIPSTSITQKFSIKFVFSDAASAAPSATVTTRSPGYSSGQSITVGDLASGGAAITLSSTKLRVPVGGDCSSTAATYQEATFDVNVRAGCFVSLVLPLDNSKCYSLDTAIRDFINTTFSATYLAAMATSAASNTSQWIPVLKVDTSISNATLGSDKKSCTSIATGYAVTIVTAKAGALTSPQSLIIGAKAEITLGDISYQCGLSNCDSTTSPAQQVEIPFSVSFVDTSKRNLASLDNFLANSSTPLQFKRQPYNFFYPLYVDSLGSS